MSAALLIPADKCVGYQGSYLKHESFPATQSLTYGTLHELASITETITAQKMYYLDVCLYGHPGNGVTCSISDQGNPAGTGANTFPYYADMGLKWTQTIAGNQILLQTDFIQSGVPIISAEAAAVSNGLNVNGTFITGDVGSTAIDDSFSLIKFGGPIYTGDNIGQTMTNVKVTFHLPPTNGNHSWELTANNRYSYVRLYEIETLDSSF
jgi:hypothetical protein